MVTCPLFWTSHCYASNQPPHDPTETRADGAEWETPFDLFGCKLSAGWLGMTNKGNGAPRLAFRG